MMSAVPVVPVVPVIFIMLMIPIHHQLNMFGSMTMFPFVVTPQAPESQNICDVRPLGIQPAHNPTGHAARERRDLPAGGSFGVWQIGSPHVPKRIFFGWELRSRSAPLVDDRHSHAKITVQNCIQLEIVVIDAQRIYKLFSNL